MAEPLLSSPTSAGIAPARKISLWKLTSTRSVASAAAASSCTLALPVLSSATSAGPPPAATICFWYSAFITATPASADAAEHCVFAAPHESNLTSGSMAPARESSAA